MVTPQGAMPTGIDFTTFRFGTSINRQTAGVTPRNTTRSRIVTPPSSLRGNGYRPGEFCPTADAGQTGTAEDGETIKCETEPLRAESLPHPLVRTRKHRPSAQRGERGCVGLQGPTLYLSRAHRFELGLA